MEKTKSIVGRSTDELWRQVEQDLADQDIYDYNVLLEQGGRQVELSIEIDPGGGFEGGYQMTSFAAHVAPEHDFRFALHHQDLIDTIGKFFGMEDVVIGYPEFDDALVVKTNDAERTHRIFSDASLRELFQALHEFTLCLTHHRVDDQEEKTPFLEFTIEEGITDPLALRNLYEAFFLILTRLDAD